MISTTSNSFLQRDCVYICVCICSRFVNNCVVTLGAATARLSYTEITQHVFQTQTPTRAPRMGTLEQAQVQAVMAASAAETATQHLLQQQQLQQQQQQNALINTAPL